VLFRPAHFRPVVRLLSRGCLAIFALAAAANASAEEFRLRALLTAPAGGSAPVVRPALLGEARVIVHADGQARLDLVSWALPAWAADAVLRVHAVDARGVSTPLLVVPLERDADEGRVIGAGFHVDAAAARRLRAGEGRILLTSEQHPDAIVLGALRLHPRPGLPAARFQASD
jgi:hypothetical protein